MPNVASAYKFQRKMVDVETAYLRQVDGYRRETRRALLEIIDRDGVSRAAVSQMTREIAALSNNIISAAAVQSKDIRKHVQNYARKNIQLAERAGLTDNTDLSAILRAGEEIARDGEQSYMTNQSAWLKQLETSIQVQAARLRTSNASSEEIANRLLSETLADGRASVWAASGNAAQSEETGNIWTYAIGLLGAFLSIFNNNEPEITYKKQAVATLDDRTTDCCLRVHGQIQPMDEPFQLTGTPRYADEIQDPPFHWYCRSVETLYHEEFEKFGITTEQMETMAQLELDARERTGTRVTIHPSHATSRRAGALPSG